jgi:hypothetical protein
VGNYDFTVGELNTQIKRESKMNLAQLGSTDASQNSYIWPYMTQALWKYAGLIFRKKVSDPLVVAANGYVTFQFGGVDISDMYAPMKILIAPEVSGSTFVHRTSFDAPNGWFKESANDRIHIKGPGTYILHYRAYHSKITSDAQTLDLPQAAYRLIQYETLALIFHSLNDVASAGAMQAIADKEIPILIKANMDSSQATSGGVVPSQNEAQYYRR